MDKQTMQQSITDIKQSVIELSEFTNYLKAELKNWKRQLDTASYLSKKIKDLASRQYKNVAIEIQSISENIDLLNSCHN